MRVYIITEGGKNVDFRHLIKCPTLAHVIEKYMSKCVNKY